MSSYKTVRQNIDNGVSQQNYNTTSIDNLPELDDLETQQYSAPVQVNNGFNAIRNSFHPYSGMNNQNSSVPHNTMIQTQIQEVEVPQPKNITTYDMPNNTPTCLDIAEHIANCPICSKFYNNDKTLYIVSIVVLSIICIILLKKVLDK